MVLVLVHGGNLINIWDKEQGERKGWAALSTLPELSQGQKCQWVPQATIAIERNKELSLEEIIV